MQPMLNSNTANIRQAQSEEYKVKRQIIYKEILVKG
jgi:hypothetical protein